MTSATLVNAVPQDVALATRPHVDHLVTEDDTPVDNVFCEKQQRLLTEPLHSSWVRSGETKRFVAMANVGLFFSVHQPPFVPDMLLSLDVELPDDIHTKPHRSYFLWEYGKPPDVVVEVVSNREGGEDSVKLSGYARIGVRYYVIFDPEHWLSDRTLRAFRPGEVAYRELPEPIWFPGVELGLRLWEGRYEDWDNTWLRWVDEQGTPIPTGAERAEHERDRAERERDRAVRECDRAERERDRAAQLAAQLRRLGVEPDA